MKLLVFGRTGQVATELQRLIPAAGGPGTGWDATGQDATGGDVAVFLGRAEADLADPAACAAAIHALQPDAVINAAAWTAVDRAESEEAAARQINGAAPAAMARACAERGLPFVQISTDYVFDGAGDRPFAPGHPTAPLGAYGRSKLEGELGVRAAGGVHAILRTSWVFSAHGGNFVKTMLRLGAERPTLTVVADQIGGPTPARAIAQACLQIADRLRQDPKLGGTYHFSGAPDVSWADFARAIMTMADLPCTISDIATSAYPTPARRPANSRMDCSTLADLGLERPDWRQGLHAVLTELGAIS